MKTIPTHLSESSSIKDVSTLFSEGRFDTLWSISPDFIEKLDLSEVEKFVEKKHLECLKELEDFITFSEELEKWSLFSDAKHAILWKRYSVIKEKYISQWYLYLPQYYSELIGRLDYTKKSLAESWFLSRMKKIREDDYCILTGHTPTTPFIKMPGHLIYLSGGSHIGMDSDVYKMKDFPTYIEYQKKFIAERIFSLKESMKDIKLSEKEKIEYLKRRRKIMVEIILAFKSLLIITKQYKDTESEALVEDGIKYLISWLKESDDLMDPMIREKKIQEDEDKKTAKETMEYLKIHGLDITRVKELEETEKTMEILSKKLSIEKWDLEKETSVHLEKLGALTSAYEEIISVLVLIESEAKKSTFGTDYKISKELLEKIKKIKKSQ